MKVLENKFKLTFRNNSFAFSNVSRGVKPFLLANLINNLSKGSILIILDNDKELNSYLKIIKKLINNNNIYALPSWDCSSYDNFSPSKQNINERFKVFTNSAKKCKKVILTSYKSIAMLLPNKDEIDNKLILFESGKDYDVEKTITNINSKGYNQVNLVLEPNEFTLRGGIIDIWPLGQDKPYRLDFFGNKLESIKEFDPISQISKLEHKSITIYQSLEPPLTDMSINIFISKYREIFGATANKNLFLHKIKNFNKLDGIEHWLPLFYEKKLISIFDYFDPATIVIDDDVIQKTFNYIDELSLSYKEKLDIYNSDKDNINGPIEPNLLYIQANNLKSNLAKVNKINLNNFTSNELPNYDLEATDNLEFISNASNETELKRMFLKVITNVDFKKKIIFAAEDSKNEIKIKFYIDNIINIYEHQVRLGKKSINDCMDDLNIIDIIIFPINHGFENSYLKLISSFEIFKIKKQPKVKAYKNNISNISSLNIEDYIVHNDHGVGRYLGLKTIKIADMPHDCLVIEYLNTAKLYIPVENINIISKYGDSGKNVILDKLGSKSWDKKRNSVKKRIRDLANALMVEAAKRDISSSVKVSINYEALSKFEEGFKFNETQDQLNSLEEVYTDILSGRSMDRLICGDVGFGKTEIALRTAFVMSNNNLKTIVIVPTTLLANQHFKTFKSRFKNYTNVGILTRNTKKSEKHIMLEQFKDSSTNILICTHSIFSIDLKEFKLGLIVVDEEQHFGVLQKEKIKKIKSNIHLLTLSATPIPRTLHMSLIGIRDLSLIKTPPVDRKNIITRVCRFEKGIIRKAIVDEKIRHGQIFLIVPRIKDIVIIIKSLKFIYPNLKYQVAHGKLKPNEIELAMTQFYNGEVDLLISTSIVESGLDIPKANTLIVYKADNFGLAQLHQLRGRIGRSSEVGHAYFTIDKDNISENAILRLKALQAMDSLGAGINLANYDLDIRGAGNLLGEEQSGQILQVGIELYQKLLKECVNDIKNIKEENNSDVQINIKLAILIPEHYISDLSLRLSIYRKLGEINNEDNIRLFEDEMINRFGPIPVEFKNLIDLMSLKSEASKARVVRIDVDQEKVLIYFNKKFEKYTKNFVDWVTDKSNMVTLLDTYKIRVNNFKTDNTNQLLQVYKIINRIKLLLLN